MRRVVFYSLLVCVLTLLLSQHAIHAPAAAAARSVPRERVTRVADSDNRFNEIHGHAGFWRIARTRDGVWWFVSPDNQTQFLNGVTTVCPQLRAYDPNEPGYRAHDWDGSADLSHWAKLTAQEVNGFGFKSLGAWCSPALHQSSMPMARDLNVMRWAPYDVPLFSSEWNRAIEKVIKDQVVPLRQNRNLIGYYIDNELNWTSMERFAPDYFRITTSLIRKYDPNHLILGCRYRGWVPAEVARASRGYTDAQSINYYAADSLLDAGTFQLISRESHQPIVISEYSFHALDGRSGNRNRVRFPGEVPTQEARAAGYRLMTTRLAQVPYIIGADWFQWMDEPPGGRCGDGEDVNFGIVDIHDRPYEQLVTAVKETAPLLNNLHAGSASNRNQFVWRTPPAGPHPPTAFAGGRDMMAK